MHFKWRGIDWDASLFAIICHVQSDLISILFSPNNQKFVQKISDYKGEFGVKQTTIQYTLSNTTLGLWLKKENLFKSAWAPWAPEKWNLHVIRCMIYGGLLNFCPIFMFAFLDERLVCNGPVYGGVPLHTNSLIFNLPPACLPAYLLTC